MNAALVSRHADPSGGEGHINTLGVSMNAALVRRGEYIKAICAP